MSCVQIKVIGLLLIIPLRMLLVQVRMLSSTPSPTPVLQKIVPMMPAKENSSLVWVTWWFLKSKKHNFSTSSGSVPTSPALMIFSTICTAPEISSNMQRDSASKQRNWSIEISLCIWRQEDNRKVSIIGKLVKKVDEKVYDEFSVDKMTPELIAQIVI